RVDYLNPRPEVHRLRRCLEGSTSGTTSPTAMLRGPLRGRLTMRLARYSPAIAGQPEGDEGRADGHDEDQGADRVGGRRQRRADHREDEGRERHALADGEEGDDEIVER